MSQLIALTSDNQDIAGAIVYWRLSGEVDGSTFNDALTAEGLEEEHIALTSPRKALRRAMKDHAHNDLFLRTHKGGLFLVRQEGETASDVDFNVKVKAHLTLAGSIPKLTVYDSEGEPTAEESEIKDTINDRFWHHVDHVTATDISSWLISQAAECDAVSLRDTGGVYFIPRHTLDAWRDRVGVVHSSTSCRVEQIPSLNSEDAVSAVLASIVDECNAFTDQLQADIESDDLGERALTGRADKAKRMIDKLGRYEGLLGNKLDDIREQMFEQQANAVSAALAAGAEVN